MTSDSASRVTRSRRSLGLAVLLFLGALAAVTALRAQETPAREPAAPPEAPPAAPAPDAPGGAEPAAAPARGGTSPGRFEPSEKVRADFDVSFPVDI